MVQFMLPSMNNSLKVFHLPIRVTACLFWLANRFSHWLTLGLVVIRAFSKLGLILTQGVDPCYRQPSMGIDGRDLFRSHRDVNRGGSLLSDVRKGKVVFALLVIGLGIMVFYRLGDIYHLQVNYEISWPTCQFSEI